MNSEGLEELLTARGGGAAAPQLPSTLPSSYGESALHCPVLLLLQRHLEVAVATTARAVLATVPARRNPGAATLEAVLACVVKGLPPRGEGAWVAATVQHAAPALEELEGRALRIMDQLYAAGYRINVYRGETGELGAAAGRCWPVFASVWQLSALVLPRVVPSQSRVTSAAQEVPCSRALQHSGTLRRLRPAPRPPPWHPCRPVRPGARRRVADGAGAGPAGRGAGQAGGGGAQQVRCLAPSSCSCS